MSNCIIRLTATKTRWRKTIAEPSVLLSFHLQEATEVMKKTSTRKRSTEAQTSPLLLTDAGVKLWLKEYRSHGNGSLSCGKIRERKTVNFPSQPRTSSFPFGLQHIRLQDLTPQWCQICYSRQSWRQACPPGLAVPRCHWWSGQGWTSPRPER